jgi:hypothetical protein
VHSSVGSPPSAPLGDFSEIIIAPGTLGTDRFLIETSDESWTGAVPGRASLKDPYGYDLSASFLRRPSPSPVYAVGPAPAALTRPAHRSERDAGPAIPATSLPAKSDGAGRDVAGRTSEDELKAGEIAGRQSETCEQQQAFERMEERTDSSTLQCAVVDRGSTRINDK